MIKFTKIFKADLETVAASLYGKGPPIAFGRFGEGEARIMEGERVSCKDGWVADKECVELAKATRECLTTDAPSWCIGVSCHCCDPSGFKWFKENVTVPTSRVTYANLLVNSNYDRFLAIYNDIGRKNFHIVGPWARRVDSPIPRNAVKPSWDWTELVAELRSVTKPILMAAGPLAGPIALDYVKSNPPVPQTILDIGSTLDPIFRGRNTRRYHRDNLASRRRVCVWPGVKV